jgi:uncharacterized protein YjbI with pentapeptide repeats
MEPTSKTKPTRYFQIAGIALIIAIPVLGLAGFGKFLDRSLQAKTLWDWMNLLLVPIFLVGGFVFLSRSQRANEPHPIEDEADVAREIAVDHQQAAALQAYVDRMSELLLKDKLSKFSSDEVRNVAKSRTLAVLRELDAKRKGSVLLFLKDSGLIDREAVIDLCGADLRGVFVANSNLSRLNLSGADLSGANLRGANLSKSFLGETNLSAANLSGANLSGADLFEANLSSANLHQTKLSKANVNAADLRGVRLNEADLRDADLSGANLNVGDLVGADLRGAKLGGAKLLGADLRQADLSEADLSGTQITDTELEKAKSLAGTTMPDGTKHI